MSASTPPSTPLAEMTCPHCGSPWMKGTGLFVCGEGINGNVHGGCRVYYTGKLISSLNEQLETYRAALEEIAGMRLEYDEPAQFAREALNPATSSEGSEALTVRGGQADLGNDPSDSSPASSPKPTDSPFPQPALESSEKSLWPDREIPGKPMNFDPASRPSE